MGVFFFFLGGIAFVGVGGLTIYAGIISAHYCIISFHYSVIIIVGFLTMQMLGVILGQLYYLDAIVKSAIKLPL